MESENQHRILIVEGDDQVKKRISTNLQTKKVDLIFSNTGESGLNEIKTANKAFSIILSAQSLDDMEGTSFLKQAKEITPDSIRFLMAVYSEMETIINAVNQSAVQRFLVKPFEAEDFLKAIKSGLKLYHSFMEHERLLNLAKIQNSKLYELNCELMETAKSHNKTIQKLDKDITTLNKIIIDFSAKKPKKTNTIPDDISNYVTGGNGVNAAKVELLFSQTIHALYHQFDELAQRNGIIMPQIDGDS